MRIFTIKKGKHRSGFFFSLFLRRPKRVAWYFMFTDDCLYSFGNDHDLDVNKLLGVSLGLHHKNSVRLGWNCNKEGKIDLYRYYYRGGKRYFNKIGEVETGLFYYAVFDFEQDCINISIGRGYKGEKGEMYMAMVYGFSKKPWFYYWLFPYFGGHMKAPQDMHIVLSRENEK